MKGRTLNLQAFAKAAMLAFTSAVFALLATLVLAQSALAWSGGAGTKDDPYQIASATDLQTLATNVNSSTTQHYSDTYFKLTQDISMKDVCSAEKGSWVPIGGWSSSGAANSTSYYFSGQFDGGGHTISDLYINNTTSYSTSSTFWGLFGYVGSPTSGQSLNASFKDLTIKGEITCTPGTGSAYTGGLIGEAYKNINISNCAVDMNISVAAGDSSHCGGIAGYNYSYLTISGCSFSGSISHPGNVGGILGRSGQSVSITDCYNLGTITGTTDSYSYCTAGILGNAGSSNSYLTVARCFNAGKMEPHTTKAVGAIAGFGAAGSSAKFSQCYVLDTIDAEMFTAQYRSTSTSVYSTPTFADDSGKYAESEFAKGGSILGKLKVDDTTNNFVQGKDNPVLAWQKTVAPPTITVQPKTMTAQTGDSVSLTTTASLPASGNPGYDGQLSFKWYKVGEGTDAKDTEVTDGVDKSVDGKTSTLTIPTTKIAQNTYYCEVTNTWTNEETGTAETQEDSVKSDKATVTIQTTEQAKAPTVTTPENASIVQGKNHDFEVTATVDGQAATLSYQWYKTTSDDTACTKGEAIDGETNATLSVPGGKDLGDFYYYCAVTQTFEWTKTAVTKTKLVKATILPIEINSLDDFVNFRNSVNDGENEKYAGFTVKLMCDLDLGTYDNWTPIGDSNSTQFAGTFEGNGHTISNLKINNTDTSNWYIGLFGSVLGGSIKNLVVKGDIKNVSTTQATGGVVGMMMNTNEAMCYMENVGFEGSVESAGSNVGGIAGYVSGMYSHYPNFKISNCYSKGTVSSTSTSSVTGVGGMLGNMLGYVDVYDSYSWSTVSAPNTTATGTRLGGFIGNLPTSGSYKVMNCYSSGKVSAAAGSAYGFAGIASAPTLETTIVSNCSFVENNTYKAEASGAVATSSKDALGYTFRDMLNKNAQVTATNTFTKANYSTYPQLTWEFNAGELMATSAATYPTDTASTHAAKQGETVKLTLDVSKNITGAAYTGSAPTSYQWYKVRTDIADQEPQAIDGATTAAYDYTVPQSDAASSQWDLYCVATYALDGNTMQCYSSTVDVNVVSSTAAKVPEIELSATPNPVVENSKTTITANVKNFNAQNPGSGEGTLTYQWYTCDASGTESSQVAVEGATAATLDQTLLGPGKHYYTCQVTNTFENTKIVSAFAPAYAVEVECKVINSADELETFAKEVNDGDTYEGRTVKLGADIDLSKLTSAATEWTPIGSYVNYSNYKAFKGIFDGQGHTVSNLNISTTSTQYAGLFGYVENATIKNVVVQGSVSGKQYLAGVIGYAKGSLTCEKVKNEASVTGTSTYLGGIVSHIATSNTSTVSFTSCVNKGNVTHSTKTGSSYAGGLVGNIANNPINANFTDCYNTGNIDGGYYMGGILGFTGSSSSKVMVSLNNCYSTGTVTSGYTGTSGYYKDAFGALVGMETVSSSVHYLNTKGCYYLKNSVVANGDTKEAQPFGWYSSYSGSLTPEATATVVDAASDITAENMGDKTGAIWRDVSGSSPQLAWELGIETLLSTDIEAIPDVAYTGSALKPEIKVVHNGVTLQENTDYTVKYQDNEGNDVASDKLINQGTYKAVVTGTATKYMGSIEATFKVTQSVIAKGDLQIIASAAYTGSAITPSIVVKHSDTTLTQGTDYTVAIYDANNTKVTEVVNAGTYTVKVEGINVYGGSDSTTFTVTPATLGASNLQAVEDIEFTGSDVAPTPVVKFNGKELANNTDYTYKFTDASDNAVSSITNVGAYKVVVEGKGNFTGTATASFNVVAATLADTDIQAIADITYTGANVAPTPKVVHGELTLTTPNDYSFKLTDAAGTEVSEITNVGTYKVVVTGTGSYKGTATASFNVVAAQLDAADVASIVDAAYTGSAIVPTVAVTHAGKTLATPADFTVKYLDAKGTEVQSIVDAGTYTVQVTGSGNYAGTISTTFTVTSASTEALAKAIADAQAAMQDVEVSADGTDVSQDAYWTTQANLDTLKAAIDAAQAVAAKASLTQADVDSAATTLNAAQRTFAETLKLGTASNVKRLAGNDSAETSAAISAEAYPTGLTNASKTVVLCKDDDFKDAMSATGLAGIWEAPILLTSATELSAATAKEIARLGAENVVIIGGEGAIKPAVQAAAAAVEGVKKVERVYGDGAEDTSVECAKRLATEKTKAGDTDFTKAIVSMQDNFQDALSISSFAYKYHVPILLESAGNTAADRKLTAGATALFAEGASFENATVFVPGGTGAVSRDSVEGTLGTRQYQRLAGESGYDTSNVIAEYLTSNGSVEGGEPYLNATTAVVATGAAATKGVDALAGAALAGKTGSTILLVNTNNSLESTNLFTINGFFFDNRATIGKAYVLGGTSVVNTNLETRMERLLQ